MARQKLYYTSAEITNNLYTSGSEYITETGINYIGVYHKYSTGEVYTGPKWNPNFSEKLIKNPNSNISDNVIQYNKISDIKIPTQHPKPFYPESKNEEYIDRFFIRKVNDFNVIEIDKQQYRDWKQNKIDKNLYIATKIKWKIQGPLETSTKNGIQEKGVAEINSETIQKANFRGLESKLNNLTELYFDDIVKKPRNIN